MKMTSPFQKYFLSVSSLTVNKQTKKLNKKKKTFWYRPRPLPGLNLSTKTDTLTNVDNGVTLHP